MTWVLLILFLAIAAAPFVIERVKPPMDAEARTAAPGQFADLPGGVTHYLWRGPEDGPVFVCIHGLTTPSYVYDALAPSLAEAGFRVLTYDLYGRGFSDRPRGRQNRAFFVGQLRDLLQDQGVSGVVTLMGYSMGGSIATAFAAADPERVHALLLLAPAGIEHNPGRLATLAQKLPLIGDWLFLALAGRALHQGALAQPAAPETVAMLAERQALESGFRGYLPAVLSSQRGMLSEVLEQDHRQLAAHGVPVAAIWGEADTVIPISALGRLKEWNRNARQAVIAGAGHGLAYTHPADVLEEIASALNG